MVASTKVIIDDPAHVRCESFVSGELVHSYTRLQPYRMVSKAERHRPLPDPLTNTYLELVEERSNPTVYDEVWLSEYSGLMGKRGTDTYVYGYLVPKAVTLSGEGIELTKAKALAKTAKYSFGESLVELNETLGLLNDTAGRLVRFGSALRRGDYNYIVRSARNERDRRKLKSVLKQDPTRRLSSGYLEIMFGWKPYFDDLVNLYNVAGDRLLQGGESVKYTSGALISNNGEWGGRKVPGTRASFRATVENSKVANLNRWGLLNVPLEVWNKVPFSFVFDWAIPVNTYLGALYGGAGLRDMRGSVTTQTMREIFYDYGALQGTVSYRSINTVRWPWNEMSPDVSLLFQKQAPYEFGKVLTTLALGRTLFSR